MRVFGQPHIFGTPLGQSAAAGGGVALPINLDFTALSDGALPAPLVGATWTIVSGQAVNTPTRGTNMLADADMEAANLNSWAQHGAPTTREKTTAEKYAGAQSLHIVPRVTATDGAQQDVSTTIGAFYELEVYGKDASSGGASCIVHNLQGTARNSNVAGTDWHLVHHTTMAHNSSGFVAVGQSVVEGWLDNAGMWALDDTSLLAVTPETVADVTLRAGLRVSLYHQIGLQMNIDDPDNPQNFVRAYIYWYFAGIVICYLWKCVDGTFTKLIEGTANYVAGAELRLVKSGTTYQMFYNNAQVGTDTTISDGSIINNTRHALLAPGGGGAVDYFFCGSDVEERSIVFAGSSITGSPLESNYTARLEDWLQTYRLDIIFSYANVAEGGHNTWSNLVRFPAELEPNAPDIAIFDPANNSDRDMDRASIEAFIRRIWTEFPSAKIVLFNIPGIGDVNDNGTLDTDMHLTQTVLALAQHYGFLVADWSARLQELVGAGHDLTEYMGDSVHPNAGGYAEMALLVQAVMPTLLSSAAQAPMPLPEPLYADASDYENAPTVTLGNANDGTTGTWTTTGTRIESSEAGATVTYTATCQSIGIYRADTMTYPAVEVSVDGGAFASVTLNQNGLALSEGRGAHTIAIKVVTTARIDEFWAI